MRESILFLKEKAEIDRLLDCGFRITAVEEDLNGSLVTFTKENRCSVRQIVTTEGRKYFPLKI
ncbi:hypothetical protein QQ991_04235 [Weizmannia coagulans]|nr:MULTISPECIES: hypothetical protein [Heyndrickxia]AEP00159.1 hypothetical protein Bcoa_0941 [Heyndrickxia coagulans 36D1]NWN93908.1 hypothetical protein [Bacillus sp. (in: firmicutes)]APB38150.1 hypothetical protein BIZ35_16205 [Heyndrickxia coagulans]ATW84327.1 hypothetical protein CIW84_15815 [Heyndrickxia coagulans]AVD55011.1 hypothetical protein C3766_02010 [Heyndrickxia coagulans]